MINVLTANKNTFTLTPAILLASLTLTACEQDQKLREPFVEMAELSGLHFVHNNNLSEELTLKAVLGSGVALFDYDLDGDLDVYLVQGAQSSQIDQPNNLAATQQDSEESATLFSDRDQLFRNDSDDANFRFENISSSAGLRSGDYGMGVAIGDLNNDAFPDIYVSAVGVNRLLINNRDGGFTKHQQSVASQDTLWSSSAVMVDVNRDGRLDLYVANFIDPDSSATAESLETCRSATTAPDFCPASKFKPLADQLFINIGSDEAGNPQFEDRSVEYGIDQVFSASISVLSADLNDDGWPDIYVTNNAGDNILWINRRGQKLIDEANRASVASGLYRETVASMGVDVADFDNDGDLDLVVAHTGGQSIALLMNTGQARFVDAPMAHAITASANGGSAASVLFMDRNGDGKLGLFSANGAISKIQSQVDAGDVFPLRQANQLFQKTPIQDSEDPYRYQWVDVSDQSGVLAAQAAVSRGAAIGDIDNDGDNDLLITNINSTPELLINARHDNNWLGIIPVLDSTKRLAIGAQVRLLNTGKTRRKDVLRARGYASASDPRIIFQLDDQGSKYDVLVTWPNGEQELFGDREAGQYHTVVQGTWNR